MQAQRPTTSMKHRTAAAAAEANEQQQLQHRVLKCPRCDSLNTKFCYYNNYSLLQPRHFCKTCRRYWTDGGGLRNIPVGGGCRKNSSKRSVVPAKQTPAAAVSSAIDFYTLSHALLPTIDVAKFNFPTLSLPPNLPVSPITSNSTHCLISMDQRSLSTANQLFLPNDTCNLPASDRLFSANPLFRSPNYHTDPPLVMQHLPLMPLKNVDVTGFQGSHLATLAPSTLASLGALMRSGLVNLDRMPQQALLHPESITTPDTFDDQLWTTMCVPPLSLIQLVESTTNPQRNLITASTLSQSLGSLPLENQSIVPSPQTELIPLVANESDDTGIDQNWTSNQLHKVTAHVQYQAHHQAQHICATTLMPSFVGDHAIQCTNRFLREPEGQANASNWAAADNTAAKWAADQLSNYDMPTSQPTSPNRRV